MDQIINWLRADYIIHSLYLIATAFFIFGIKLMSKEDSASKGNWISVLGMGLAIVATFLKEPLDQSWVWIALLIGGAIGAYFALKVKMTDMPEMVALFNGCGGLASLLLGWGQYHYTFSESSLSISTSNALVTFLAVLIGSVTTTGSVVAFGKLRELIPTRPIVLPFARLLNLGLILGILLLGMLYTQNPNSGWGYTLFVGIILLTAIMGVTFVIPIGGADMPVVISLLNSYSGLAACAAGFVIQSQILIVAGCLVGASGVILTVIMCKAMNRSLSNVLFSGLSVSKTSSSSKSAHQGEVKAMSPADAYYILEAAQSVVIVPGYGLAVSQAQHAVREFTELLEANDCEVQFAIHPVAGRMPGHMNVLLAEANVPYDQLVEMDDINKVIENIDVCIVIGANDVVNPAAREDANPMPIIDADKAKTVFVLKRSMASGFAGIDNPLFTLDKTRMIFGDAKKTIESLIEEFKD